jgi:hypothetical protein
MNVGTISPTITQTHIERTGLVRQGSLGYEAMNSTPRKRNIMLPQRHRWENQDIVQMPRHEEEQPETLQERSLNNLSVHLMSVSAGMVGICLTVIGLFKIVIHLQRMGTIAADLVAIDSVCFLVVCMIAYCALRSTDRKHRQRLARVADGLFLVSLSFMAFICGVIVWAIS